MGFAEELVKNRKATHMTQEELAEKCDVSRQAVSKWESGESIPDVYVIANLAKLFNVSIEDLIWSRDVSILENKNFYIRKIQESDRNDFCMILREHRYLGEMLKLVDKINVTDVMPDDMHWNVYLNEELTYVVRSRKDDSFVGYVYFEDIKTNSPQMTMQFDKKREYVEEDFSLLRDLFNYVYDKFQTRAIHVYTNSPMKRQLFEYLGYNNVEDEVMLALPV